MPDQVFDPSRPGFPETSQEKQQLYFLLSCFSTKEPVALNKIKPKMGTKTWAKLGFDAESAQSAIHAIATKGWLRVTQIKSKDHYSLTHEASELLASLDLSIKQEEEAISRAKEAEKQLKAEQKRLADETAAEKKRKAEETKQAKEAEKQLKAEQKRIDKEAATAKKQKAEEEKKAKEAEKQRIAEEKRLEKEAKERQKQEAAEAIRREKELAEKRLKGYQTGFVLLSFLRAPNMTLSDSELKDREDKNVRTRWKDHGLDAEKVMTIRDQLSRDGMLRSTTTDRNNEFQLTEAGIRHLASVEIHPKLSVTITGKAIADLVKVLLETAGKSSPQMSPIATSSKSHKPVGNLRDTIIECFEKLRREKYFGAGTIPIHEIRASIRTLMGDKAASHEVFDEELKMLREEGKYLLVAITMDPSVTRQQLEDSVPGFKETLFYMEIAR